MAAAGDRGRGLIPPCGRCRQIMLDLHPDILVAVPTPDGPRMRPIAKMLPDTYFFPDARAERVFRLNKRYYEAVADGTKTSSVRWDERASTGPAIFYFEDDDRPPLRGEILEVNRYRPSELTPERLNLSGTDTVEDFLLGLRRHYPAMPAGAEVDIVTFAIR